MSVLDKIKVKAKADVKHVVLPEGEEERTIARRRLSPKKALPSLRFWATLKPSRQRRKRSACASRALML